MPLNLPDPQHAISPSFKPVTIVTPYFNPKGDSEFKFCEVKVLNFSRAWLHNTTQHLFQFSTISSVVLQVGSESVGCTHILLLPYVRQRGCFWLDMLQQIHPPIDQLRTLTMYINQEMVLKIVHTIFGGMINSLCQTTIEVIDWILEPLQLFLHFQEDIVQLNIM